MIIEKDLTLRIKKLLEEDPTAFAIYNNRPEITRKTALAIIKEIKEYISKKGGKFRAFKQSYTETIKGDVILFKVSTTIEIETKNENGETILIEEQAYGLCSTEENQNLHDAHATAETRSIKRVVEEMLGEDLINRIALKLLNQMDKDESQYKEPNESDEKELKEKIENLIFYARKTKLPITLMITKATGITIEKPKTIEELTQKLKELGSDIIDKVLKQYEKELEKDKKLASVK
ncbi:MAG: hypothetical protein ACK4FM_05185 [Caldimicrobium sp.]